MPNNCLLTKLKSSVDNDNLDYLGTLRIDFYQRGATAANRAVAINLPSGVEIRSTKNISIYQYSGDKSLIVGDVTQYTTTFLGTYLIALPDDNGACYIGNKYGIRSISTWVNHPIVGVGDRNAVHGIEIDLGQFDFGTDLFFVDGWLDTYKGEYKGVYRLPNLQKFYMQYIGTKTTDTAINISSFSAATTSVQEISTHGTLNSYGNISVFGNKVNMTSCDLFNSRNIEGELAAVLNNMASNGRTSGSLTFNAVNTKATYNGELITSDLCRRLNNGGDAYSLKFTFSASGWTQVPM